MPHGIPQRKGASNHADFPAFLEGRFTIDIPLKGAVFEYGILDTIKSSFKI
jgi:hypothetical protein